MAAWHEAEADAWEAKAESARFACDVLRDLRGLDQTENGATPGPRRASAARAFAARLVARLR